MNTPAVELDSLNHRYGDRLALNDVSLTVRPGCIFALLGPNGGGKTTLFKILATLMTPTSGSARIDGADVVSQQRAVRERIGVVFQKPSLDVYLTVAENMRHQGNFYGQSGEKLRLRSGELLERFGVADRANDRVKALSGGLQRRVELAKSLLHRPRVLILDEPSTGLDPGARVGLTDYLVELRDKDGVTSLLTTHLMDEADRCDVVGVIDQGRLVAQGSPAELKAMIGGDVITIHAADPDSLAKRTSQRFGTQADVMDGVVRIERPKGHEFVPDLIEAFPGEIESVTVGKPTLEDVFQHVTGHRLWDENSSASNGGGKKHG
ncbi:MAG: ATP-binding cassette domain-containing protein [Planctomycetota bacterium]|jgi:ABC-2 type transport system ATP-binding protein